MAMTAFEEFLILFNKLKSEINELPENLDWLPLEKPTLQNLCYELDKCYSKINRSIVSKGSKHTIVPTTFASLWHEYESNFRDPVAKAAQIEKKRNEKEQLKVIKQIMKESDVTEEEFWDEYKKQHPQDIGSAFDPMKDDAASLVEQLFDKLFMILDNDLLPETFTDEQLGAFLYFKNTIGLKLHDINRRWGEAPELFIPEHTLDKNIQPLIDLYNQAARTYVFGLNVASIAMCRALLEHVLKYHYKIKKWGLKDIISYAEKKYSRLVKLNLQDFRELGK